MGAIFTFILLFSSIILIFGDSDAFLGALISSGKSGLETAITLFCIYGVWMGLSAVAKECKLTQKVSRLLSPVCKKIFKVKDGQALENISMNLACNLLGVGGASTPFALKAMERLEQEKNLRAQKTLFLINATGLQIFPTTVIALRASYQSQNSGDIFLPTLICSLITLGVALSLFLAGEKLCRR